MISMLTIRDPINAEHILEKFTKLCKKTSYEKSYGHTKKFRRLSLKMSQISSENKESFHKMGEKNPSHRKSECLQICLKDHKDKVIGDQKYVKHFLVR